MINKFEEFAFNEELTQLINSIPDSDIPSETNIIKQIGNNWIYIEGWCERCFSNYDLDGREEMVDWARNETKRLLEKQPNLPQNKMLRNRELVDWKFIELQENEVNFCLSVGIYK